VERRRANEAASRLEQQVLELQSRLEAAQHRERSAQADAERLRAASSKQQADARQLGGALSQLEVAEAALRDSQGTAGRLLQDCTALQRENRRLGEEERQLTAQLQGTLR
jgi:chromosome segregation ATPase